MTQISLNLPQSYHDRAQALAKREGISLDQFIALALAETMSVLESQEYLDARAARASRQKYDAVLKAIPSRPPLEGDTPLPTK